MNPCISLLEEILNGATKSGLGTAASLAQRAEVAPETISRIRRRGTADFFTVAKLANAAGFELALVPSRKPAQTTGHKSEQIGLQFPYDWSNPNMDDTSLIANVLDRNRFVDVAKVCKHFGLQKVIESASQLGLDKRPDIQRSFENISIGFGQNAAA